MLYPLKFKPVYKDYIWGGRELEKLGKVLPPGIIAESWEISSHKDGISEIAEGELSGKLLTEVIDEYGKKLIGDIVCQNSKFPLLIKFIDANDRLSVQVHPNDEYANKYENGELGKNEMWYIIDAKPGARLIYGIKPGVDRESFKKAVENGTLEGCLNSITVSKGDVLNIPAGLVHAIGEGILIAEIQQNSNTTYRVYDYNRVDTQGKGRPLHIEKALEVIDFNSTHSSINKQIKLDLCNNSYKVIRLANKYFALEEYYVNDIVEEETDGSKFFIYIVIDGNGKIDWEGGSIDIKRGETLLIPAEPCRYKINGNIKLLKTYVPDLDKDIIEPLVKLGYTSLEVINSLNLI